MVAPYIKGRAKEYRVKKFLEERGYVVFRCAGSKPVDLIALKKGKKPLLIEIKLTKYHKRRQLEEQLRLAERAGADYAFIGKGEIKDYLQLDE